MVSTLSITPTITSLEVARTLDTQIETYFRSSVKKGCMRSNPRGGTITKFKSKIGDGFGTTKARALNGVRESIPDF